MLTRVVVILLWVVVFDAAPAFSQPIPAGMKVGLATYLRAGYGGLKTELSEAAEMMPDADYRSKPGAAPEMRTYGQLFAHVAEGQFGTCATLKGVPNPAAGRKLELELKTKREFTKALADSFAFCDEVFGGLTDANALDFVKAGQGELVKGAVLTGFLAHASEMYGISTVYLRAKNLVPPSTRQQMKSQSPSAR